jgi:hypothetical protein
MFVHKLRHTIAAQQHRKVVKPCYNTLKFYALDQKHGHWGLRFSEGVQKQVLKPVIFFSHYDYPFIFIVMPASLHAGRSAYI